MFKILKTHIYTYAIILTVFSLLCSCATTEQQDLMRQELNRLRTDNIYIKKELNKLKEKSLEVASEDSFNVVRQSQAEMQSQLSKIAGDIQLLNGRFEEHKYFIEKSLKDSTGDIELLKAQMNTIENQIKDTNERVAALENKIGIHKEALQTQPQETEKEPIESMIETQPQEESPYSLLDRVRKYEDAYHTFKEKKYEEARKKFEMFLKEYPQDDLSDNAQFWIAETYYRENDYENAILSYEIVLKKYKDSQKTPNAFFKQGLAFIELGDKKTGKLILEQLQERYPDSREAGLAKTYLQKLKNP